MLNQKFIGFITLLIIGLLMGCVAVDRPTPMDVVRPMCPRQPGNCSETPPTDKTQVITIVGNSVSVTHDPLTVCSGKKVTFTSNPSTKFAILFDRGDFPGNAGVGPNDIWSTDVGGQETLEIHVRPMLQACAWYSVIVKDGGVIKSLDPAWIIDR